MKCKEFATYSIETDGTTVWVNTTMCLGRFGPKGVDVHATLEQQIESGNPCLDCTHGLPPVASWERFKASMMQHHQITVPDSFAPAFVRTASI